MLTMKIIYIMHKNINISLDTSRNVQAITMALVYRHV